MWNVWDSAKVTGFSARISCILSQKEKNKTKHPWVRGGEERTLLFTTVAVAREAATFAETLNPSSCRVMWRESSNTRHIMGYYRKGSPSWGSGKLLWALSILLYAPEQSIVSSKVVYCIFLKDSVRIKTVSASSLRTCKYVRDPWSFFNKKQPHTGKNKCHVG